MRMEEFIDVLKNIESYLKEDVSSLVLMSNSLRSLIRRAQHEGNLSRFSYSVVFAYLYPTVEERESSNPLTSDKKINYVKQQWMNIDNDNG